MRASLNDIVQTERFILDTMREEERRDFERRMRTNSLLRASKRLLEKVIRLVHLHHREQVKEEARVVGDSLLAGGHHLAFQKEIQQIFS